MKGEREREEWGRKGGRDFKYKTTFGLPDEKELSDLLRVEARGQPLKSLGCHSMSVIAGQVAAESLKGILSWRTTCSRLTFSKVSSCRSQLVGVEHILQGQWLSQPSILERGFPGLLI